MLLAAWDSLKMPGFKLVRDAWLRVVAEFIQCPSPFLKLLRYKPCDPE
jgi:hypothetical protein